jgi:hypothetical protein
MNGRTPSQDLLNGPAWNGAGEWPFDIWLRRTLADQHDATLVETLPTEWLTLLDQVPGQTRR